jgi:HD-like signal output (HDOD) protein
MLAGLMHDIGAIPILTGAAHYPRVADSDVLLDRVLERLRGDCGAMILRKWEFAPEFVDVALHAEDWQREGGTRPDYTDVVIIAQMHSYIGTPRIADIPRIDTVPAFQKMAVGDLSPRMSLKVMDEAEEEINGMQQLLN